MEEVDRYVVIGNPVAHSLSPMIHQMFAEQTGEVIEYNRLLAPRDDFIGTVSAFFDAGGAGANVTVPFKEEAFFWATERDEYAGTAGAANTLVRVAGGVRGCNTDGLGLVADLRRLLGPLDGVSVVLVGAGGAVRGVIGPLLGAGAARIVIVNRTHSRAVELVERFEDPRLEVAPMSAPLNGVDLVVNGTSAGLDGAVPALPPATVAGTLAYDMLYGAGETAFLSWARRAGAAKLVDGLGMLVEQAAEAFLLFRGVRPRTAGVLDVVRGGL